MLRILPKLLVILAVASTVVHSEDNPIVRVGVAVPQNQSGRSVPLDVERDRLVRALNDLKPDKKTHLKVQAVPLGGSTGNEVSDQAEQQKCTYIVYTTITELRGALDPYQRLPNTVESNPNSQWTTQNPNNGPEFRATVEYKLFNTVGHTATAGATYSTQAATNEIDTVSQVMDRIANSVFSDIKKGGLPPPMRE